MGEARRDGAGRPAEILGIAAALLACALAAQAQVTASLAPAPGDRRALEAMERGFWVVQPGDTLMRVARHFTSNEEDARRLAHALQASNDHALINNDPGKLVVGARIRLRPEPKLASGAPVAPVVPRAVPPMDASASAAGPYAPGSPRAAGMPPMTGVPPISGVPPLAANVPPPAPKETPPATPAYVDRVLPGAADDREFGLDDRPRDGSPGLRQYAVELRSDSRRVSTTGNTRADGVGLRYAMETERLGDFTGLGQLTHFQAPSDDPRGDRTRATGTLLHENFALGGGYLANSAAGVIRPLFPIWLTSSYRVTFAPSLLAGVQTAINSPDSDLRVGAGRIGQLSGFGIQQFERTSGEQAVASYVHRLIGGWSVGGAAIGVRGSNSIREHTAATLGVNRDLGPDGPGIKAQVASTDEGEGAAWFDAVVRSGRLLQRFGAYHADPGFAFGESAAARDVRGAYWRGEYRAAGDFYSFGVEATQDNLKRDPARGGNDTAGGYANVTLRLERTLQAGGGVSLRNEDPRVPNGTARRVGYANLFLSKAWDSAVTRLDANVNTSRPRGMPAEGTTYLAWNQTWPRLGSVDVSTIVSQSDENLSDRNVRRRLAAIQARGPVYGNVRWDASLTFVDIDDSRGSERNYNGSLGLDWNPMPQWTFQLLWFRNRIQPGPDNPLAPFVREDTVQLMARYEDSAGTPYPRVAGGRSGSGRVTGSVFFDENGDGTRQPNERGAPGVQVILDERMTAVTDNEGRYQFPLVPAGAHRVRILVEKVPLPYGLADDSPREVRVDVRGDARLDFGLTRIGP